MFASSYSFSGVCNLSVSLFVFEKVTCSPSFFLSRSDLIYAEI